mmetsp:Transcript_5961/g.15183  ORF Transcript_5961/g.15183 Transcript_5961/m.15183 type:complete len:342 (-) Transcript_5961:1145-2170(-)
MSWRSLICSLMASSMRLRLSSFWPSSSLILYPPFLPLLRFSASARSARASCFSFSSSSRRMRVSSRERRSSSRRFVSVASFLRCVATRVSSCSFSCSCSTRSCSSLRRSMITLRARASLCSTSTLDSSSSVLLCDDAREAAAAEADEVASGYIILTPVRSFCAMSTRWFLMLSLSNCSPSNRTHLFWWSRRTETAPPLVASTRMRSTWENSRNGTICCSVSSFIVWYTWADCCSMRTTARLCMRGRNSSNTMVGMGLAAESSTVSAPSGANTFSACLHKSRGWNSFSKSAYSWRASVDTRERIPLEMSSESSALRESTSRGSRLGSKVYPRSVAMRTSRSF